MLDSTLFHQMADATLMHLHDQLEQAFEDGDLEDLALYDGILTIELNSGKTLIINKHTASGQIWLASPISGGLHFDLDSEVHEWKLRSGESIKDILHKELLSLADIRITF